MCEQCSVCGRKTHGERTSGGANCFSVLGSLSVCSTGNSVREHSFGTGAISVAFAGIKAFKAAHSIFFWTHAILKKHHV